MKTNILFVDNDVNTVETFKVVLTIQGDYKVDVACSGKEALEKLKASYPLYDLLILDIMMPKISGIDVCQLMAQSKKLKKIPVLLISALPIASKDFQKSLEKFDELNVVKGVIEKPVSTDDFLAKVREVIREL